MSAEKDARGNKKSFGSDASGGGVAFPGILRNGNGNQSQMNHNQTNQNMRDRDDDDRDYYNHMDREREGRRSDAMTYVNHDLRDDVMAMMPEGLRSGGGRHAMGGGDRDRDRDDSFGAGRKSMSPQDVKRNSGRDGRGFADRMLDTPPGDTPDIDEE